MTAKKHPYTEPVASLMRLGKVDGRSDWRDYLAMGFTEAHIPELCRMVLDEDLYWTDSESDEVWSALHAWRTLAQLRAESAIPTLIELLGRPDTIEDDWATEELPVVFGYLGEAALEPVRIFLANPDYDLYARASVARSFVEIGQRHPELRAECVAALSDQLAQFAHQDPALNAFLIGYLLDLQAVEAAPVIEQAFAADQVDLLVQGDWEQVQIELGLLDERTTPEPNYRALMAEQMGFDPDEMLGKIKRLVQEKSPSQTEREAHRQARAQRKAKRKQARKQRKKQRKRKK